MKHLIPEIEIVDINTIHPNKSNPRMIKDKKFLKLIESIENFPEMLYIRPIVIDTHNTIIGGNMRYEACKEIGYTEIPIIKAVKLTQNQLNEFIIKDNITSGEWDIDKLANEWDEEDLKNWDVIKELKLDKVLDKLKDNEEDKETITFKVKLSQLNYYDTMNKLSIISDTLEDAFMIVINAYQINKGI